MSTTPSWENWDSQHGRWTVLSNGIARLLETAFRDPSISTTSVAGLTFNVDGMNYPPNNPVRRGKRDAPNACMYHDGYAFTSLGPYTSTLIIDAKHYGRSRTCFYLQDNIAYDVSLTGPATQTNRHTGTNRALYIPSMPQIAGNDAADDDDADDDEEIEVDHELVDSMPDTFSKPLMCPITSDIFRKPVVAGDGHTYERSAIVRWLTTKHTSPLTGKPMEDQSLRVNHNIKQLVDALKPETPVAAASSGKRKKSAGPKKMKAMRG
jgi:hypothetical protein